MHISMNAAQSVQHTAPAKINLALHVTGRRDDGYHLLDMFVVFADYGDIIRVEHATRDQFTVSGRFEEGVPLDGGNLVVKARDALRAYIARDLPPVSIHLEKNLPIAAGIGGGSSDAAATLLALNDLWQLKLTADILAELGLKLGADLPMCLHGAAFGTPLLARGIGEQLSPVEGMPGLDLLLINDGTAVATPAVFQALTKRDHPALALPPQGGVDAICSYLASTRNDLLPAALKLAPNISDKLDFLRENGALFAQMSGSGATCFAIFEDMASADMAASAIRSMNPEWLVISTKTRPSAD